MGASINFKGGYQSQISLEFSSFQQHSRNSCWGYLLPPHYQIWFPHFLPKLFFPLICFSQREKAWQFAKISYCQWYSFCLGLKYISFLLFLEMIHKSFFVLCKLIYLQQLEFFKELFLKCVLSIMDLDNALVMKGLLFPQRYFFFLGAWCSISFWHNSKNSCGFLV